MTEENAAEPHCGMMQRRRARKFHLDLIC